MKRLAVYGASGCGRGVMPLLRAQTKAANDVDSELAFVEARTQGGVDERPSTCSR